MNKQFSTINDILQFRASEQKKRLAFTYLADGKNISESLTYGHLELRVKSIASVIQEMTNPGERVLLLYASDLNYIQGFLACLYAGRIAVPIYPPENTDADMKRFMGIVSDAIPSLILTTSKVFSMIPEGFAKSPNLGSMNWIESDLVSSDVSKNWEKPEIMDDSIAFLQYTSGSTSAPKGVMITHKNLMSNQKMMHEALNTNEETIMVGWLPLFHDLGLVGNILQALYAGVNSYIMDPKTFLQNPIVWLEAISKFKATISGGPNFAYEICATMTTEEQRKGLDLTSWEIAFTGSEKVRHDTLEIFTKTFEPYGFDRNAFYPGYGLAEATLFVSAPKLNDPLLALSVDKKSLQANLVKILNSKNDEGIKIIGCGKTWGEQQIIIVNLNNQEICSDKEVGEVWIKGTNVAAGYWENPEKTEKDFGNYINGDGPFLRTGDYGFLMHGELYITGRIKEMIIIRGKNYYPQDIELSVKNSHPCLAMGSTVAFSAETDFGEQLVIVQEILEEEKDYQEIFNAIIKSISKGHELQVFDILLVKKGEIHKTRSGKIQRNKCLADYTDNNLAIIARNGTEYSNIDKEGTGRSKELADLITNSNRQDLIVEYLIDCLSKLTGQSQEVFDKTKPIITLGLDSMLALQFKMAIEKDLKSDISLSDIFNGFTILDLAKYIDEESNENKSLEADQRISKTVLDSTTFNLSSGQKGIWFIQQLDSESPAYNIPVAFRLKGTINLDSFKLALSKLVNRHAVMRTKFLTINDEPVQIISNETELNLCLHDCSGLNETEITQLISDEALKPFNLSNDTLYKVCIFLKSSSESLLLIVMHHTITDFWSLSILADELGKLYTLEINNINAELPHTPLEYIDFVVWQEEMISNNSQEMRLFWKNYLKGGFSILDLPYKQNKKQKGIAETLNLNVSNKILGDIKSMANAENSTIYVILLAALNTLLYKYTGQEDIIIGSPTTGRSKVGFSEIVGYFVNPVVVKTHISGEMTFINILNEVRQNMTEIFKYSNFPLTEVINELHLNREHKSNSLFQVMFVYQKSQLSSNLEGINKLAIGEGGINLNLGGIDVESIALSRVPAQFDLTIMATEDSDGLVFSFQYDVGMFEKCTIQSIIRAFNNLLHNLSEMKHKNIDDIPLVLGDEYTKIIKTWNNTYKDYGVPLNLKELFENQVNHSPNQIALQFRESQLTYSELNRRANKLAHYLKHKGVKKDILVGVCMERSMELVISLYAIIKAGGAYVPLDPEYPKSRLDYTITNSDMQLVLTQAEYEKILLDSNKEILKLDSEWWIIDAYSKENISTNPDPQDLAYVIYTSGTTGMPKGVMNTHQGISNRLLWMQDEYCLNETDKILQKTPFSFDVSVWEFFWPLQVGASLIIAEPGGHRDSDYLVRVIEEKDITTVHFVPSMLGIFLENSNVKICKSLRRVICSGEALSYGLQERFFECFECQLHNLYGPTEAAVDVTSWKCSKNGGYKIVPIGKPIANTQIYIVDKRLNPVPVGVAGELCIGGVNLARGYYKNDKLTAEKFVTTSFIEGKEERIYKTGDLARFLPDGNIDFLGRNDFQVKIRGFRVELEEISSLLKSYEGIRDAIVIAKGETENKHLIAYVISAMNLNIELHKIKQYLRKKLPDYMIPTYFVNINEFPLTPSGKLSIKDLPSPKKENTNINKDFTQPKSSIEKKIVMIWKEVLEIDSIGLHDNFFDIGGNSLLIAKVHSKLKKAFDKDITLIELFDNPTISLLSNLYKQEDNDHKTQKINYNYSNSNTDIAIIGMEGKFPGARNVEEFWDNLKVGKETITFFTKEELAENGVDEWFTSKPNYVNAGGVIEDIEYFDANFFEYSPKEAVFTDPQQRLFLETSYQALESSGYITEEYKGRIGVFAGVGMNTYIHNFDLSELLVPSTETYQLLIGNDKDFVPTRVSYKLNLKGPSVNVNTACSTSLVAVHMGCQSLNNGESDMIIAGGASITIPQKTGHLYEIGGILSPDGHCRAFDEKAEGTVHGNGVGVVVLKRLEDAIKDRDTIYAVIKGSAINNDGALKVGYTAPSIEGQAGVIAAAQDVAGVLPETISYIETHGTGTVLGDPIEIAALNRVFKVSTSKKNFCAIGSVKTNIGHLDAAAGITGLIKTCLCIKNRTLVPSLNFEKANPQIDFENSPFWVNTGTRKWENGEYPLRAGVSSFGIGGTNAHLILEEPPVIEESLESPRKWKIITVSAKSKEALNKANENLLSYIDKNPDSKLEDISYTLQKGRKRYSYANVFVSDSNNDALKKLDIKDKSKLFSSCTDSNERLVAFMFPGQGSQYINMAFELYENEQIFRQTVDYCSDYLLDIIKIDIRDVLFPTNMSDSDASMKLMQTEFTQPILFIIEYALAKMWEDWGVTPEAMIGHSLGEYVAATISGVFTLDAALELLAFRGKLVQHLPKGSMLSIFKSEEDVKKIVEEQGGSLAAINGDNLCVISGTDKVIDKIERQLEDEGIVVKKLHTSHAFHSEMLDSILEDFRKKIDEIDLGVPKIKFLSNLTGTWITDEEATCSNYWVQQLRGTVQFSKGLKTLLEDDFILLEIGPGRTMCTLTKSLGSDYKDSIAIQCLSDVSSSQSDLYFSAVALGKLWLHGGKIEWDKYYRNECRNIIPLPTYPFERKKYWQNLVRREHRQVLDIQHEKEEESEQKNNESELYERPNLDTNYVKPKSKIEQELATIFSELLKISKIGIEDSFFELGGDSLTGTQLMTQIKEKYDIQLPLKELFNHPTISLLKEKLTINDSKSEEIIVPEKRTVTSIPLSMMQQRIWFLSQLEPETTAYNLPIVMRIKGDLSAEKLERSIVRIIERHSILRTNFNHVNGESFQNIHENFIFNLEQDDLTRFESIEEERELKKILDREIVKPFDLENELLIRSRLIKIDKKEYVFFIVIHHIIFDGWSMGVLMKEIQTIYEALSKNTEPILEDLQIQYSDYTLLQLEKFQSDWFKDEIEYWRERLSEAQTILDLPTDFARPTIQTYNGARYKVIMDEKLSQSIKRYCKKENVTLYMFILAAYDILLSKYSGQTDILVGTPIANRDSSYLTNMMGLFINTIVTRSDVDNRESFKEFLGKVKETSLNAFAHSKVPFEKIVEVVQPERQMSHSPIFQVMFSMLNTSLPNYSFGGLEVFGEDVDVVSSKVDMELSLFEENDNIRGWIDYNTDLFKESTIERMYKHLIAILEQSVANPDMFIEEIELVTGEEYQKIVYDWNATDKNYNLDTSLCNLFEEQVERTPESIAVVFRESQLTYKELNEKSNQLAHYLVKKGIERDKLVGVCMERSLEMVTAMYGILKAGGAYVPLDPDYPTARLDYMIRDSRVNTVLTQNHLKELLSKYDINLLCLDSEWDDIEENEKFNFTEKPHPKDIAYTIYTSGSTGNPKGVMNTHRGISNRLIWMQEAYKLDHLDKVLQKTPFSFDVSVWEFFWPLQTGACLVIAEPNGHKDSKYLLDVIVDSGITTIHFVPSMLSIFLEESGISKAISLKRVICSGEALTYNLQEKFFESINAELHNLYGPTEAAIDVTSWECKKDAEYNIVPIGRPISNTKIYILDQNMRPVPIGVVGELYIGGVNLARGYYNNINLTNERFLKNPFISDENSRIYKTGDLARFMSDGNIEYIGRTDFQVKIRGLRVELGEIEAKLASHPGVKEVVVTIIERTTDDKCLVAYIVNQTNILNTSIDLRDYLKQSLPEYMIPTIYSFVENIPLLPNGKINRRALPHIDFSQHGIRSKEYIEPQNDIEKNIVDIWKQFLNTDQVGVNDNFFDLGGHSIILAQIYNKLRSEYIDKYITMVDLFRYPTPSSLAEFLAEDAPVVEDFEDAKLRSERKRQALENKKNVRRRK